MNQTILLSGHRAGKVTEFCKMMGWSVKPYQKILLLRFSFGNAYKKYMAYLLIKDPYEYLYRKPNKDGWIKIWFDEASI